MKRDKRDAAMTTHFGNCLNVLPTLPAQSVHTCVTSPPYWGLRDYGVDGQFGLEATPDEYVDNMVAVFREVKRVLRDDGTLWLNLGDSYASNPASGGPQTENLKGHQNATPERACTRPAGLKPKDLVGIPWRVAFALQADGWYLRQDIIWHKPNPMPESVTDRCTKAHEYIFLLSKSQRYYYDAEAVKMPASIESQKRLLRGNSDNHKNVDGAPGQTKHSTHQPRPRMEGELSEATRNKRSVWTVPPQTYKGAHFATFPPKLIEPCVLAGCPLGGTVLDPFMGSGTTAQVAQELGREWVGIELNEEYRSLQDNRTSQQVLAL